MRDRVCKCPLCTSEWLKPAMLYALLAGFALSYLGCVPPRQEHSPLERAGIHAAVQGWLLAGLPSPNAESCDFSHVYIRWADTDQEFEELCRATKVNVACTLWDSSSHFFRPLMYPVIELRPGFLLLPDSEPIIHECMHALTRCSGLPFWLPGNTQHLDARIWTAAETDANRGLSAQSRARALVLQ